MTPGPKSSSPNLVTITRENAPLYGWDHLGATINTDTGGIVNPFRPAADGYDNTPRFNGYQIPQTPYTATEAATTAVRNNLAPPVIPNPLYGSTPSGNTGSTNPIFSTRGGGYNPTTTGAPSTGGQPYNPTTTTGAPATGGQPVTGSPITTTKPVTTTVPANATTTTTTNPTGTGGETVNTTPASTTPATSSGAYFSMPKASSVQNPSRSGVTSALMKRYNPTFW